MRICLYTNTALPCIGGQELVVDELARRFLALRHEVAVLCPHPPRGVTVRDEEYPYQVFRHRRFVSTRWFVEWYLNALRGLRRQFPYDLIHCHNVYPNGYLAALHKLQGGPPVVITSHGGDVRDDNPRFRKPGLIDRHRLAVRHADALVSISRFTETGFTQLGAMPEQIFGIPNGVDVALFRKPVPRPEALPPHLQTGKFLLFLGRLVWRKGVDNLLQAIKVWQEREPAKSVPHLAIAGDGTERPNLEAMRRELQLEGQVSFLGSVRGAGKVWLLQNAFALVIPTREWEAMPMVLLEGFAAGCCVIVSNAPGLKDLVQPDDLGWVTERNNAGALADGLRRLWARPEVAAQYRQRTDSVARQCDWRIVTDRHLELYDRVCARPGRRAA